MADALTAWLYGTPVATLRPSGRSLRNLELRWRPEGLARWGNQSRILSVSLPFGTPFSPGKNRALDFFENLLPEGPTRAVMAELAGVTSSDVFGMLAEFGGDCAGAIVLQSADETDPNAANGSYRTYSEAELAHAVVNLYRRPFGTALEHGFKPSLPGFQSKLLVGRSKDGVWSRPVNGAPSTWIIKPDGRIPIAENEFACLSLAAASGMRTAQAEVITIGGTPALAVERYDRTPTLDRVHQEDGCQATGAPAGWKYESEGGPSLAAIAGVLRDFAGVEDREQLLRRTTFNVVIGNADAHAKNLSIVHTRAGEIALAPLYDTCATVALRATNDQGIAIPNDPTMGQMIDGILDINRVRQANLIAEATRWGLRPQRARVVVEETIEAVLVAADRAPDWLGSLVRERAGAVRDG